MSTTAPPFISAGTARVIGQDSRVSARLYPELAETLNTYRQERQARGQDASDSVLLREALELLLAQAGYTIPAPAEPGLPPFDVERHVLGVLCKHAHAYPGTTQSLRYRKGDKDCVVCKRARQSKHLKK